MNKQTSESNSNAPQSTPRFVLRDPAWAALLGWLWPGAGHIYQKRYGKGALFMICILTTYFYGLALGDGHVVYASWRPNDYRWQYFCQLGTGIPAFPAMIQSIKVNKGGDPFFVTEEYDPDHFPAMNEEGIKGPLKEGFMAPPPGPIFANDSDILAVWNDELKHRFEIGTLYTVVAGLLNLLAVYDAFAGPALLHHRDPTKKKSKDKAGGSKEDADSGGDDESSGNASDGN